MIFDEVIDRHNTDCHKWDSNYTDDPKMISMWVADMDFPTCPAVSKALSDLAINGIYGYGMVSKKYLNSVVNWMKRRYDFSIDEQWIVPVPGVVTAIKVAIDAYTKENDRIMIMEPVYYPFGLSIEGLHRHTVIMTLDQVDTHYELDFEKFEKSIIDNDVKMLIFCNPHNPVGKVWNKEELLKIGQICQKHHAYVVSDEIHLDFVFTNEHHIPFITLDDSFKDFTIICTAASKSFNLAGLANANILIPNEDMRKLYTDTASAHGVGQPNIMGLKATEVAYEEGEEWLDGVTAYIKDNVNYMDAYLKKHIPELIMMDHQGLYLTWVDCRKLGMNAKELHTFMLEEAHIWLDDGDMFGVSGEGFMRFNLACPRITLEKALKQLEEAVNKYLKK